MSQFIVVHVGQRTVALPLERVLGVHGSVPVAPVPLVAPHVEGLAAVRGDVLMVVGLRRLAGQEGAPAPADGGRLVLIRDASGQGRSHGLALRVDRVAGMVSADELDPVTADVPPGLADAVLGQLEYKGRPALVLRPDAVGTVGAAPAETAESFTGPLSPPAPAPEAALAVGAEDEGVAGRRRALVVRVGGTELAIALDTVREVFDLGDLRRPPGAAWQVLGLKPLRHRLVVVLSLANLLRIEGADAPAKAILVGRPGRRFALAVDAVLGIRAFRVADDMPDLFIDDAGKMVRHLGTDRLEDDRLTALLSPYLEVVQAEDVVQEAEETRRFITFDVGATRCALDLGRVRAVMPWRRPDPVPKSDAADAADVDGVVNGGGEVLPVLDLPRWLGEEAAEAAQRNAFVVAEVGGEPWALAVNRLGRVISVPASAVEPVGTRGRLAAFIRRDDAPVWVLGLRAAGEGEAVRDAG